MAVCEMKIAVLLFVTYVSTVESETFTVTSPIVQDEDLVLQCTVPTTPTWTVDITKRGVNRTILHVSSNCTFRSLSLAAAYKYTCDWTRDGAVVSLVVKNANRNRDYGTWTCQSEEVKLEVTILQKDYRVPTKTVTLMDVPTLYADKRYNLVCVTSASNPPPEVTWRYRSGDNDRELHLSGIVISSTHDGSMYVTTSRLPYTMKRGDNFNMIYCTANNGFVNVTSQKKQLDVWYPAEVRILSVVNPYTIWEGTMLFLKCEFTDGNPRPSSVRWYKNNVVIGNKFIYRKTRARAYDEGNYTCVVRNSMAFPAATASRFVNVLYKPRIVVPSRKQVLEGTFVNASCIIKSHHLYPITPSLIWTHEGKSGSTTRVSQDGAVMYINRIQSGQAGRYICSAENKIDDSSGNQRTFYMSGFMTIDVLYPPVINLPSRWSIEELSTLNLSCMAKGNPPVTSGEYSWRGTDDFIAAQQELVIDTIKRDQSGNYTCVVKKYLHSSDYIQRKTFTAESAVYIDVQYSPSIDLPNSTMEVKEHNILRITCVVHAHPPAHTIRWMLPDGAVVPSDRLSLPHIQQNQGGEYKCEAINRIKVAMASPEDRSNSKSIWIVVLPTQTTRTTAPAGNHAPSGLSSASLIGIGVVIGVIAVLLIVCIVVVFNRKRKTSKQGRVKKSDFADKAVRYKNGVRSRLGNNVIHRNDERQNSYADIAYVDGGYLNPAVVLTSGIKQGNPCTDSTDGGYLNPSHDVISDGKRGHIYTDTSNGGYLNPAHTDPLDYDVTSEITKGNMYTNASDGEYLNPAYDVSSECSEGHTYADPQDTDYLNVCDVSERSTLNDLSYSVKDSLDMKTATSVQHGAYIHPCVEQNKLDANNLYEELQQTLKTNKKY